MLNFLKRIRHRFIKENRVTKYLLYAIGEILLVVIGILIALQVNNWNQRNLAQAEVETYLSNLKGALKDDIRSLEISGSYNKIRLYGIFYILNHANLNTATFTEVPWAKIDRNDNLHTGWHGPFPDTLNKEFTTLVFSKLGRGFGIASFNKSVINELYATGMYSNIEDELLKQKIADYYRYLSQRLEGYAIEEHEEWANETTRFLRDRYGIFTLDVSDIEDPFTIIRGQKDVEHYLRYLALEVNYHITWGNVAHEMATELIAHIDSTINDPN